MKAQVKAAGFPIGIDCCASSARPASRREQSARSASKCPTKEGWSGLPTSSSLTQKGDHEHRRPLRSDQARGRDLHPSARLVAPAWRSWLALTARASRRRRFAGQSPLRAVWVWQLPREILPLMAPAALTPMYEPVGADVAEELRCRTERHLDAVVAEVARDLPEAACIQVDQQAVEGNAAEALVQAARNEELLVVGSRGRGGFTGLLLGSVSQACAHHARCPVVIVRPRRDGSVDAVERPDREQEHDDRGRGGEAELADGGQP
jgi:nucleotide-binding universal stress UspA family protein